MRVHTSKEKKPRRHVTYTGRIVYDRKPHEFSHTDYARITKAILTVSYGVADVTTNAKAMFAGLLQAVGIELVKRKAPDALPEDVLPGLIDVFTGFVIEKIEKPEEYLQALFSVKSSPYQNQKPSYKE